MKQQPNVAYFYDPDAPQEQKWWHNPKGYRQKQRSAFAAYCLGCLGLCYWIIFIVIAIWFFWLFIYPYTFGNI